MNTYIERIEKHAERNGKQSAIERGRTMICGWTLGREFGESSEAYFARNPLYVEFEKWFEQWQERSAS